MDQIELNNFKAQWSLVREQAHMAFERTGQSGWLVLGKEVKAFEENLAAYWGLSEAIACANGLDAIELGLRALGIREGDSVLTTPLSAFATTLAILRAGGKPIFIDTDETGLLDLDLAAEVLRKRPDIRFMVPVHLYGFPLNLEKLRRLKEEFQLKIVEDCAQSIGAKWNDYPVGTIGEIAATSFYPTKNLGCMGDGGALLTQTPRLAQLARQLRDYGQEAKYVHSRLGMNSRLDEIQASILNDALLPRLSDWVQRRTEIAQAYLQGINHPQIQLIRPQLQACSVWHLFPVLIRGDRKSFQDHLQSQGILSAIHYPFLISQQPALQESERGFEVISGLSRAEEIASKEVSLPIHPFLSNEDIERVVSACNSWPVTASVSASKGNSNQVAIKCF